MSNYRAPAIHPDTGVDQMADWLPHYYGRRCGAVRFTDGKVFDAELIDTVPPTSCCGCCKSRQGTTWSESHSAGWRRFYLHKREYVVCPTCRLYDDIEQDSTLTDCLRRVIEEED